jgi:hypothetical protein
MSRLVTLTRTGSAPRTICYPFSKIGRRYSFQNPPNEIKPEVTGKGLRHIPPKISEEIKNYRNVNLHPQPNSNRTLIPDLAPEPKKINVRNSETFTNSLNYNYNNNYFDNNNNYNNNNNNYYYNEEKLFQSKRRPNSSYMSTYDNSNYNSYNNNNNYSNFNNENYKNSNIDGFYEDINSKRRQHADTQFSRYKTTTQIYNLHGGIKRNINEINDDKKYLDTKPFLKLDQPSYSIKICDDYKSNVSCLPNSLTKYNEKNVYNNKYINNFKKFENNDIFNRGNAYSNVRTNYRLKGKKLYNQNGRDLFNYESQKLGNLYDNQGIKKYYKNNSQIEF